jgi:hypothetical protein
MENGLTADPLRFGRIRGRAFERMDPAAPKVVPFRIRSNAGIADRDQAPLSAAVGTEGRVDGGPLVHEKGQERRNASGDEDIHFFGFPGFL